MKTKFAFSVCILICIHWAACSTDFELAGEWKETTVVYGVLNARDSVHYIRIQKAFLGEGINAFEVAQIGDSLYHEVAPTVKVEVYDVAEKNFDKQYNLQKIEAISVDIEKEEGIFATEPHWLYQFTHPLTADSLYQLVIETQRGNTIKGSTPIIDNFELRYPDSDDTLSLLQNFEVLFETAPNGFSYSLYLHFNYTNKSLTNNDTLQEDVTAIWPIFSNKKIVPFNDRITLSEHQVQSDLFFNFLLGKIPVSDTISERNFKSIDLVFWVANEDYYNYDQFVRANLGITSFHAGQPFTNLEGGIGVLASRYQKVVKNIQITPSTLDAIACSPATRQLRFLPNRAHPFYPYCF